MAEIMEIEATFHNRTRTAPSIPRKLWREKKPYLIPVYYFMLLSELAREGITNSGSYRFADHLYAARPRGRYFIGRLLDRLLLQLPSATAFRSRYLFSKQELHKFIKSRLPKVDRLDIAAIPSGLARELFEVAEELEKDKVPGREKVYWSGYDLDADLVNKLNAKAEKLPYKMSFQVTDVFQLTTPSHYDMTVSLGLVEFLSDEQTEKFFQILHRQLKSEGKMITSGMRPHPLSEYLMRNLGELHTHYRSPSELERLATRAGFEESATYQDKTKLQTMLISGKNRR